MGLALRDRTVLDAARDDDELALVQRQDAVAELHVEPPVHHEEKLVLGVVSMPDELALELDELDVLAVQLADDLRIQ